MWQAICEDIAMAAGGPMGSPIKHVFTRHFKSFENAKKACEVHVGPRGPIKWKKRRDGGFDSGDMGAYQYTIKPFKTED